MKPNYNLCDVCGNKTFDTSSLFIPTGTSRLPTGELETNGRHVDLCPKCLFAVTSSLMASDINLEYKVSTFVQTHIKKHGRAT